MTTQIQSQDLEGGVVAPGNYKYYGTDGVGAKAFQDIATILTALGYTTGGGSSGGVGGNGLSLIEANTVFA